MNVSLFIPHYFKTDSTSSPSIYGSTRENNQFKRSLSFARSLESLLSLERSPSDYILNIKNKSLERTVECHESSSNISITILQMVVIILMMFSPYASRVKIVHCVNCEDPTRIPYITMLNLLQSDSSADIYGFIEDDLVITDPLYFDKINAFYQSFPNGHIFMPHRYEKTTLNRPHKFYVDGLISTQNYSSDLLTESSNNRILHSYQFMGSTIDLVKASNPHSGLFSSPSHRATAIENLPPAPFMNMLETASTGVAIKSFSILKTCWSQRNFFQIEHGNPSFLHYMNKWPLAD